MNIELDDILKHELLMFVLERSDVQHFNASIKNFSVQQLYSRFKRELKSEYPELMPTDMYYSIVMCDVFREYRCDEIDCPALLRKIDLIKGLLPTYKRMNVERWTEKVIQHDLLVREYMEKLEPQNKIIKLYKKVLKQRKLVA
jgi:hypothetical protein